MLSTALVAIDTTVIATAVPSIVRDVGGFTQFPWLFSAYLLTQSVTVPLYGRIADVAGRRGVLTIGIAVFVGGSLLCGAAPSMPALIAARAVQGIGAGAVQPITMTLVGDLYTVAERARVQGYVASVWAAASVAGPAVGGLFSQYLSWRWIFFVNLPVGILAVWMLRRHLHEDVERRPHELDWTGAALLVTGSTLVILGLLQGGVGWPWASPAGLLTPLAGVVLLGGFVVFERRLDRRGGEPVLPPWVLRRRVLAGGNLVGVGVGALLIGVSSYVPTYAQGVLRAGPLLAGFAVSALSIGWPLAATVSGRVYLRIGFRDTALLGGAFVVAGTLWGVALTSRSSVATLAAACFVVGVGLGLASSPALVAVQSAVGWERRGVVTATAMFSRSIGSAVGVAVFGALANAVLAGTTDGAGGPSAAALDAATHRVFVALLVTGVLTAGAVLLIPRRTDAPD